MQINSHGMVIAMLEAHWAHVLLAGGSTSVVLVVVLDWVLKVGQWWELAKMFTGDAN